MINYLMDSVSAALTLINRDKRKAINLSSAPETVISYFDETRRLASTRSAILEYYNNVPNLRSITSRIADDIASIDWQLSVLRRGGPKGTPFRDRKLQRARNSFRKMARQNMKDQYCKQGEFFVVEDHPLLDLLDTGNGFHTGTEVFKLVQLYLDLRGEAFIQIKPGPGGLPDSLWALHPSWIVDVPKTPKGYFEVQPIRRGGSRSTHRIPQDQMIWIKDPNPQAPYGRSVGLAETLGDELETDEWAAAHVKSFFSNGAIPDGIVSIEGAKAEQVKDLEQRWNDQMQGARKAHRVKFTNAKIDAKMLGHSFRDQEIVNLRLHQRDIAAQTFNMPPEILGIIENSNRATIDAAQFLYAIGILVPRAERIRSALQRDLIPLYDSNLVFDYVSPVPEDHEFKRTVMQGNKGAYTRAEHRALADFDSHGDVDDVYVMQLADIERPVNGDFEKPEPGVVPTPEEPSKSAPVVYKAASIEDIDNVLEALRPEYIDELTTPLMEEELSRWAKMKARELGVEANFDLLNPRFTQRIREYATDRIPEINEATRKAVRTALSEGVYAGEGIVGLARRLDDVFGRAARSRSIRIARTEVTDKSSYSTLEVYKTSGVVMGKQWVSTPDARTRQAHSGLSGQIRQLDAPFVDEDGASAMHPGSFEDVGKNVNCRCTIVAVTTEEEMGKGYDAFARKAIWDRHEAQRKPWDQALKSAYAQAFRKQQRAAERALRDTLRI